MDETVYRSQLAHMLQENGIPRTMWESMIEYIMVGRPVGDFLEALLCNDLMKAVAKADLINIQRLQDYCMFLIGCAPIGCYGTPAAYKEWMKTGGVVGRAQQRQASNLQT